MSPIRVSTIMWSFPQAFRPAFNKQQLFRRVYCTAGIPYQSDDVPIVYKNGFPTVNVMLPSRDERCLFTLRPFTDTVGTFLNMVSEEDGGVERIALYKKDGTKIAKSTTVDILLSEDFDMIINSRKFAVSTPSIDDGGNERQAVAQVKDLITHLYTQMNLTEWQAAKEKELELSVEKIQHELAPYMALREEMMEKAERRAHRMKFVGLGLMGVQFGFLARLTWWEYSWDIMEPVTYFVTYGTTMAMFAYYVLTNQEFLFPEVRNRGFLLHLHKQANNSKYDVDHYNSLMRKLDEAEGHLKRLQKPLGTTLPASEIQALLKNKPAE